jgi:hypothetical protein
LVNKQKDRYFTNIELFFQYSQIKNNLYFEPNLNTTPSFYELGIRFYLKEGSRTSLSTSIQTGKITWEYGGYDDITQLNVNCLFDLYRSKKANIYLNARLLEAIYLVENGKESSYNIAPRINFGLGYRYYILNKISLFVELNQLFNIEKIPSNLSIGFSYIL